MRDAERAPMRVAWKLREVQHRHMMLIHGAVDGIGLHFSQPRILHVVSEMNGATQKEIANRLQVSPASLAMSIKRMQKAGLLEKSGDEKDLRVNYIRLTEKGREIEEKCFACLKETDNRMLEGFDGEDIDKLYGYLERICVNLERIGEKKHDWKTHPVL